MTTTTFQQWLANPQPLSTSTFVDILLSDAYPDVFAQLNKLQEKLQELSQEYREEILLHFFQKIESEWDEMYRKEKLVLFPFILTLEEEHKTSDSCKPFKNVKQHYTAVLQSIVQLKLYLDDLLSANDTPTDIQIGLQQLNTIEKTMIRLQTNKDRHLFAKFKNCTGCQNIH